jgi:hypothetical protein
MNTLAAFGKPSNQFSEGLECPKQVEVLVGPGDGGRGEGGKRQDDNCGEACEASHVAQARNGILNRGHHKRSISRFLAASCLSEDMNEPRGTEGIHARVKSCECTFTDRSAARWTTAAVSAT